MSQLYYSVCSRYLVFSAIISVLICQAMARYRFNHNYLLREQERRQRSFEYAKEELPKLLQLFLKPSFINHHKSEQINHSTHGQETPPLIFDTKINTSCGHINCENVTNYPLQLIKDLLEEQSFGNSEEIIIPETNAEDELLDQYEDTYDIKTEISVRAQAKSYEPHDILYPNEYVDDDYSRPTKQNCIQISDKFRAEQDRKYNKVDRNKNLCEYKVKEINPEETVDENNQRIFLVNDKSSIVISSYICIAGTDCIDQSTPEGYKYHCETHFAQPELCTLKEDGTAIVKNRPYMADGCQCNVTKIELK